MVDLKKKREEKGLSQQALADAVGVARQMVSHIECGTRRPSVETAKLFAKVLNFDWTLFYT